MTSGMALPQYIESLVFSEKFADVVLVARTEDGTTKDLPSHLCILARSPVLDRMFSGAFAESKLKRVDIPVAKVKHLELVRDYLYTEKMKFSDDWTAHDCVDLMALFDKYEVTSAFSLVSKELMDRLDKLGLDDAEQILEQMASTVGQQELVQEALARIVPKVIVGSQVIEFLMWLQGLHKRSGLPVNAALAKIVPKVEFGSQVMQCLVWLQQFHRSSGLPVQTARDACLLKVSDDQAALESELAVNHVNACEMDVMQSKMLMLAKFVQKVSGSLNDCCHATGTGSGGGFCQRKGCTSFVSRSVTVTTSAQINTAEKPKLSFGIGRLIDEMNVAFTGEPQLAAVDPACPSAKKQKTS